MCRQNVVGSMPFEENDMDIDNDIVSTSPNSTPSIQHGSGLRGQRLPPLPFVPGISFQSTDNVTQITLTAQHVGSQREIRASRNTQPSRSISMENWVVTRTIPSQENVDQNIDLEVVDSPRSDVISMEDNSSTDDVIESEDEADVVTIVEDSDNEVYEVSDSEGSNSRETNNAGTVQEEEPVIIGDELNSGSDTENRDTSNPDIPNDGVDGASASTSTDGNNIESSVSTSSTSAPIPNASISSTSASISNTSVSMSNMSTFISSTPAPVPSTPAPVPSTSAPVPSTSAPLPNTSAPVPSTPTPVPSTSAPVPSTSAPVPSTSTITFDPESLDPSSGIQSSTAATVTNQELSSSHSPHVSRLLERHNDSMSEFRSPKRKRIFSPEKQDANKNKESTDTNQEEEDGDTCPICFEQWTTSGNHRLCSLKCGHLFGQSCIEKWLKGQGGKCPHCNAKAKRQDIRVLFAKNIKALDTSERDRALKDLEKEKELRRKVEMETAQLRLQYQMSIEDTNKLRLELETLKSQMRKSGQAPAAATTSSQVKIEPASQSLPLSGQFVLEKTIKICEGGNCRVMAYSHSLATLVVSQPSSSQLFPGFGIKKISSLDFKTSQYLTIHSKAIRDMAFHQNVEDGLLLSCGLDKKIKLTNLISNAVVQSYDTPMPGWSCAWNGGDCNYFYAGLQNGLVLQFDVRNTGEPVQEFNKEGSRSPVVSLVYVKANPDGDFRSSGLLIGQLDRVSFLENTTQGERIHILPLEGSLTSLQVDQQTRHMLASYRPTARHPTIRHQLCELTCTNISTNPTVINNVCSCNIVHTFHGGRKQTVLSKTLIQRHPGDQNRLLVCGGDETSNSVHVWDSGTGRLTQRLMADGMVVDLCKFSLNQQQYLAALTDKQCKVYKWR